MVKINSSSVVIGGRSYNKDKSGYPHTPTVFSGLEISWGAASCIDHPDPSRATISLWVPKTHEEWVPSLGEEVTIQASIEAGGDLASSYPATIFAGKIESVKLQDDHKAIPAPIIPNSQNITTITGWGLTSASANFSGPRVDISSQVTISDDMFYMPFQWIDGATTNWMFTKTPKTPVTAGVAYTATWATNYVGTQSVWLYYYDSSGAQVGTTTLVNNLPQRVTFTPPTGATQVQVETIAGMASSYTAVQGLYGIGKFILSTGTPPGYHVNVVAADALAEASRLRLSSTPWGYENVLNRQVKIADLATKSGVKFNSGLTEAQGYYESLDTYVAPRDVDSFPALELFQRTTMAAGHTVLSSKNAVQPSTTLELPQILSASQPASGTVYSYNNAGVGTFEMKVNGVLTRTNWARYNRAYVTPANIYTAVAGTGGAANVGAYSSKAKVGTDRWTANWTTSATGGPQSMSYKQSSISGPVSTKVSAGFWAMSSVTRTVVATVRLYSVGATVGAASSSVVTLVANEWQWVKAENVTSLQAYDAVEVLLEPQTNMLAGQQLSMDGVLIEKAATVGAYFDDNTLDPASSVVAVERSYVTVIDASAIVDDVFELDTSNVVNEIKVELKKVTMSGNTVTSVEDFDQVYSDEVGSRKTTPQSRSISTDWAILDVNMQDLLPTSTMVTKSKLLLSGQSKPVWRMSNAMAIVLSQLPTQESMYQLLWEADRFGRLIKITNAPRFVPTYMRVRGGKIVLGDNPSMEFDLEPVEYSAPIPLSGATLSSDDVASNYKLRNFKTLTANDLRSIGAR